MTRLGSMGRFGNQLFQYMFLRTYAREHEPQVQVPPWIGNRLFGLNDHRPDGYSYPVIAEKDVHDVDDTIIPHARQPYLNHDFVGYFQYHTSYYARHKTFIRELFRPEPAIGIALDQGWQRITDGKTPIVGIHLRRTDYGYSFFYRVPFEWYTAILRQLQRTLGPFLLYIATDDETDVRGSFASFELRMACDIRVDLDWATFYPDFYALTRCDVLVIPNSSFSFAASMLNEQLQASYRSSLTLKTFKPFDPWLDRPVHQDECVS